MFNNYFVDPSPPKEMLAAELLQELVAAGPVLVSWRCWAGKGVPACAKFRAILFRVE